MKYTLIITLAVDPVSPVESHVPAKTITHDAHYAFRYGNRRDQAAMYAAAARIVMGHQPGKEFLVPYHRRYVLYTIRAVTAAALRDGRTTVATWDGTAFVAASEPAMTA